MKSLLYALRSASAGGVVKLSLMTCEAWVESGSAGLETELLALRHLARIWADILA
jgi:hypothetical protein